VVFIKDLIVAGPQQGRGGGGAEGEKENYDEEEEEGAKVEGTGSGFVWDSAGHIVSAFNFHPCWHFCSNSTEISRVGISAL
jgi:hypothetical protein